MSATRDPRPLTGEPLALDLLNTRWNKEGVTQDLLADPEGLAVWLGSNGLAGAHPASPEVLGHLREAREAIKAAVDGADERAVPLVDAVLAHGRIRARLTATGPAEEAEFADPAWGPAWLAARDYLELLTRAPERIRTCAGGACILYFLDTSRNGTRRWCSMAACGNRAKASRHYARSKEN
ncbi:CGNR zinc finger domain-containing protein [Streptomyces actinomycinicus]|uniref:CGNR zinc finger domain-containing protein n=1 Tax=Streptomyces actinomycinicus TaxID=1695166 RepID=A0A937ED40_9ACTN|nr:CGNR zinc finger domain-containing protein [Streptomyces actinomycinicus]MBL1080662.1 CGNR zinc finger domain-containing protein [Streptomyces actinomycinicus]